MNKSANFSSVVLATCFLPMDAIQVDAFKRFGEALRQRGSRLIVLTADAERVGDALDLGFEALSLPSSLAEYDTTQYVEEEIVASPFDTWLADTDANWWGGVFGRDIKRSLQGIPRCTHAARKIFEAIRPSVALLWSSGVFPASRIWHDVARQMGIPAFCLERGVLPGTWMLDAGGMNVQSDMRSHPLIRRQLLQHTATDKIEAYRQWYLNARPRKYGSPGKGAAVVRDKLSVDGRLVVILGGLDCAGLTPRSLPGAELNSPGYLDSRDVAHAVSVALQNEPELRIVFKAHPGEIANFTEDSIGNVDVVRDIDPIDLILAADVVVAGLTGLAFETLLNKRPLVLVAKSPLQGTGSAYEALQPEELGGAIRAALSNSKKDIFNKADAFLDGLLTNALYSTDQNIPAIQIDELAEHCVGIGGYGAPDTFRAKMALHTATPSYVSPRIEYAQLFFDTGSGFNEEQSIKHGISLSNNHIEFSLPSEISNIFRLRIDPINNYSAITINSVTLITKEATSINAEELSTNASYIEKSVHFFDHDDPQVHFNVPHSLLNSLKKITINFDLIKTGQAAIVLARRIQVFNLNQTVAERDGEIYTLNQTVAERDGEIYTLNQTVAERDGQIYNLNQTMTERDEQIDGLSHVVTGRDSQIAVLVAVRDRYQSSWMYRLRRKLSIMQWQRALTMSPLFNADWYLQCYPDVSSASIDPLRHYLTNGWREGRNPGPEFDGSYYLARYRDIAQLDMPPLVHYWLHGRFEGRWMNSTLDVDWHPICAAANRVGLSAVEVAQSPFISVIIPTYNRIKLLPNVVASWRKVHACTKTPYELIFSDDGSEDGSAEFLESVGDLPIKVLRNAHGGASSARNAAIRIATGERLLIIGDDIFPDPEILNIHSELGMRLGDMVATLGSVNWHEDIPVNHLMHHITEVGNEQFSYNRLPDGAYVDFRHFYTCNICVPRHFFAAERVLFDERFNEYGFEDIELGYRLALRGLLIYFTTSATGAHYHPYKTANFCRRQISAGRMAVVFAGMHPGVRQLIGITNNARQVKAKDPLWQSRVNQLMLRCEEYEHLIDSLPQDLSAGVRSLLSLLYSHLFRAMYEYGVLQKQGMSKSPLTLAMTNHFLGLGDDYWAMLNARAGRPIRLPVDEACNLGEALMTGRVEDLLYGDEQRAVFEELARIRDLGRVGGGRALRRVSHLFSRGFYHLFRDPRHLLMRVRQILAEQYSARRQTMSLPLVHTPLQAAIPGLVVDVGDKNRMELIAGSRAIFGNQLQVYELVGDGLLARLDEIGQLAAPEIPEDVDATVFFWPVSTRFVHCPDRLLSAYMAVIENGLSIAVISHSLSAGATVTVGDWRDHVVFARAMASKVLTGKTGGIGVSGKVLRMLPAWGGEQAHGLDRLLGQELSVSEDGFFNSRAGKFLAPDRYRPPFLPARAKTKPVVFVFPIFLAVGGVERNTVEIIRGLRNRFDFVVITMERLRAEQGSLVGQAQEVAERVIEMSEIVRHTDYLRVLTRLKTNLQPDLVWVCNGSPWFCDNAAAIRRIFNDIPIIDQEVYDVEQGWINRYAEPGIRSFDHFIAINTKIKARFIDDFCIDHERVHLIYSAIDTARIRHYKAVAPDEAESRGKFGLPIGKRLFTFVARLTPQKRPVEFLKLALRRIRHEDEFFVLVGDGELAGEVEAFITKHGLHNVKRIPYIANTLELNAISSGIVFTSAYEGLPIAMLEALSMGVPCFATDVGDISDVLHEYGGGDVFPVAMEADDVATAFEAWMARHYEYAASLRKREDEIIERFSSGNIAEQYVACWQAAMAEYRRRTV